MSATSRKEIWAQTRNWSSRQGLFNSTLHFSLKSLFPEFHQAELTVTVVKRVQGEQGFPDGSDSEESAKEETWVQSLGWKDTLEEGMAPVFLP